MIDINKPSILYVVKNTQNNLKYYGMIHKKDKTIYQRLHDHIVGRGAGVFLHKAITELGEIYFTIEEVERGSFNYISMREKELTKDSLWLEGRGYNGNSGRCILMDAEMYERKIQSTDMVKRTAAWRETYNSNRNKHNHARSEQYRLKQEEINWSRYRGKTKYDCVKLMDRSNNMKERCKNPTSSMILGRLKARETRRGQNKDNCERIRKSSETRKRNKTSAGRNNPSFTGYWITPYGRYETAEEAALYLNISKSTLTTWCKHNKILKVGFYKNNSLILNEWDNKTTTEIGFYKDEWASFLKNT